MKPSALVLAPLAVILALACQTVPAPVREPEAMPIETPAAEPAEEIVTGTVRVTASTLNVRSGPSTSEPAVATVKRGERVGLIRTEGIWSRVRLADGSAGWVASRYVRADRRCPPDRQYRFATMPVPSFPEAAARGTVVVEATVDRTGRVVATRILSNTTGDEDLGRTVESEIRLARFEPPVHNCVTRGFLYTYTRTF